MNDKLLLLALEVSNVTGYYVSQAFDMKLTLNRNEHCLIEIAGAHCLNVAKVRHKLMNPKHKL